MSSYPPIPSRKDHGLHNERLCDLLLTDGRFNDWVITSAFYSALNFVKHEIFPLNISGVRKFDEFETYYQQYEKKGIDKHQSLASLVSRNMKCGGAYRWLLDNAKMSRYNNYQVSPAKAKKAHELLCAIKTNCKK